MLALAHHYDETVATTDGVIYRVRVYGGAIEDGRWGGWIVFFPVGGGRVISTDRETTQSSMADLSYWASGLTHAYIEGALERALSLEPEAQIVHDLERLERIETEAELRANTLSAAAEVARAESKIAAATRDVVEEELLETVAAGAALDAKVHEAAAAAARETAQAAGRALRERKPRASARKKK
jgi:hypothetical protein